MILSEAPPEILCRILLLSDPQTILICSSVLRTWKQTIAGSSQLQCELELWKAGLVCGFPSFIPMADKRQALDKYLRAWQKLEWRSKSAIDLPALHTAKGRALVAGIFTFQENGSNIYTITLQQDTRVTKHVLGIDPDAYVRLTIDPTQDLLAVVYSSTPGSESFTLALRSL
ncbi:hypothetical protein FB45DRAFT_1039064 [Roridomyces roridus]|uniref:F-box domain-containing protein n=1 Tax=Roridomyces roridus TaxID=1738132 RepID=A0AAD7B3W8_9AGAR|nr:hypothetical protein FB45DRAFT_1039064 [Roridomyces roridus]